MSWTKRNTLICDECGKFCSIQKADEYTLYGSRSYEDPEPLDPMHICQKCFPKVKEDFIKQFRAGNRGGDWMKSRAEKEAAEECGLVWSNGIGVLGSKKKWEDPHKYITKERYNELKDLPYYGWCEICGGKRRGGYCMNTLCEKMPDWLKEQNSLEDIKK